MQNAGSSDANPAGSGWRCPFAVGQVLESRVAFTPESVRAFATMANDVNPLHHDAEIAARSRFGGLIASGAQTTGVLLGSLAGHIPEGNASLGLSCAFRLRTATPADAKTLARWTVAEIVPKPSLAGVLVELSGSLEDENGAVYVEAT